MSGQFPDFTGWTVARLLDHRKHLEQILVVSAGQCDPVRPQLRAEHEMVRAEITRRMTCPACLDGNHEEREDPCKCPCPGGEPDVIPPWCPLPQGDQALRDIGY